MKPIEPEHAYNSARTRPTLGASKKPTSYKAMAQQHGSLSGGGYLT